MKFVRRSESYDAYRRFAVLACAFAFCLSNVAFAADESGIKAATSVNFVATTTKEAKVKLIETVTVPFLVGRTALTSGNNVQLRGTAELSPVSVNGTFETRLTPIAFLQFVAGGSIGSGWNIPIAKGLKKNTLVNDHESEFIGGAFDGLVWSVKAGGQFQFDLAALVPGEWNHIVFQTYHAAQYRALTSASSGESWLYEADEGENRNGWNYYGCYFLGYQMPIALNMVGVLFEEDLYLYNVENGALWGDDLSRWTFGPMFNFTVTKDLSVALLVQARTRRTYTDETEDYTFYQSRRVDDSNPRHVEFYRAAINATLRLK
jgi:hypothetical protein